MSCLINQDIENCLFILNDIQKFYIGDYSSSIEVNYDSTDERIIDISTDINWEQIVFNTISIQTEYDRIDKTFSTLIKIEIDEIENELSLYIVNGKKYVILFIDKNGNCFADGVLPNDNSYKINNIQTEISLEKNLLSFELSKLSNVNIKQIDNNYFIFNNL
ncbi:hypothetical protein UFOVP648_20 [uncultured Caudovirales phage]|uniref:Uncharacterized protein n=1 Tax=uncultured Caudovirales phage TaxID=2100421 RepID=A0A6J5NBT4_9CAUD|nr:hypothetical protein UFOVP648_20 [uncultured Caudovirales phage]